MHRARLVLALSDVTLRWAMHHWLHPSAALVGSLAGVASALQQQQQQQQFAGSRTGRLPTTQASSGSIPDSVERLRRDTHNLMLRVRGSNQLMATRG